MRENRCCGTLVSILDRMRHWGPPPWSATSGRDTLAQKREGWSRLAQVRTVNTSDIPGAIRLARRTMGSVFNADDGDIPFFRSAVRPQAYLGFSDSFSEAHVPGRHLNALLTAEEVLEESADEAVIARHRRAARFSYSGAVPLSLNRTELRGPLVRFLPHNLREGFHALYALFRYRQDEEARDLAEASIAAIRRYWDTTRGWDRQRLADVGIRLVELEEFFAPEDRVPAASFISGIARAIGPLVKYHRATGSPAAIDLALALKEKAVADYFWADGSHDLRRFSLHTHSATCTLSGLAQLADLTGDEELKERVRAFYRNGLTAISDPLGWSIENCRAGADPDRGEANNTGDILETALLIGKWGDPWGYAEAERILRGHLLPSQLRDVSFIQDPENPTGEDGKRDVAKRHLGAFGFPAPYGHAPLECREVSFNMDIVGGATASLCEAYRSVVTQDPDGGQAVNLLFDHETDGLRVESPYPSGELGLTAKRPGRIRVRIPVWVDRSALRVQGASVEFAGDWLLVAEPPVGQLVRISMPLAEHEIELRHRTRTIRTRLRGDEVIAMDSYGADLTFFPEF